MLRISKLTDYAVALTTYLARCQVGPGAPGSASEAGDLGRAAAQPAATDQVGHGIGSEVGHGVGPEVGHGIGPEVTHGVGPEAAHGIGPEVAYGIGPEVAYGVGPEAAYGVGPEAAHGVAHEVGPEVAHGVAHEVAHEVGPEVGHENVRVLAAATGVPEPTVRKVLKTLVHAGIVGSVRGTHGGYALARPAADISVADVVIAVEGPIAVTECANEATVGACDLEGRCNVQGPWQRISAAIRDALDRLTLADMATPGPAGDSATDRAGDRAGARDRTIVPLRVAGAPLRTTGQPSGSDGPAPPSNLESNP